MKIRKFLSVVLALVMLMSLSSVTGGLTVTASAQGAVLASGEVSGEGDIGIWTLTEPYSEGHTHEWSAPVWTWTEDYTASAVFTCTDCDESRTEEADVTYSDGTYTATVVLDDETYTDTKVKTATLTLDMDGKAENITLILPVGELLALYLAENLIDSDDGLYHACGFLTKPQGQFDDLIAMRTDRLRNFLLLMPETDLTLWVQWNEITTVQISVSAPKCGMPVSDVASIFTVSAPEKYTVSNIEADTDDTIFYGGKDYYIFASVDPNEGYAVSFELPVVTGAEIEEFEPGSYFSLLLLKIAAQHYTDETSEVKETILTPATMTTDGVKEVCVCCAGGCGEVVERYRERIPAIGACRYCGETHDKGTVAGWWTSFFHNFLFILNCLLTWWK